MRKIVVILFLNALLAGGPVHASDNLSKANALFGSARYQDALPLYQSLLSSPPQKTSMGGIHTKIADCYYHLGLYKNAIESHRAALNLEDRASQPETRYWIGFCCLLLGQNEQAVNEFLKIPELYPEAAMWSSTAYYWAGRASERLGWKAKAAEFYKMAGGNGKSTQGRYAMKRAENMNRGASSK